MEYRFETIYDKKALTAMARALRKTIRKKRSKRAHIIGILAAFCGISLVVGDDIFGIRQIITLLAVAAIVIVLIFEDRLNGHIAHKRSLPGTERAVTVFFEDGYKSTTAIGETTFFYDAIYTIAEDPQYITFIFSTNHAQIYEKRTLQGGSLEDFIAFLSTRTHAPFIRL